MITTSPLVRVAGSSPSGDCGQERAHGAGHLDEGFAGDSARTEGAAEAVNEAGEAPKNYWGYTRRAQGLGVGLTLVPQRVEARRDDEGRCHATQPLCVEYGEA